MLKLLLIYGGLSLVFAVAWAWFGWRDQGDLDALDAEWLAETGRPGGAPGD